MEQDDQKRKKITLPGRGTLSSNFGEGLDRVRQGLGRAIQPADVPVPGPAVPRRKLNLGERIGRGLRSRFGGGETSPVALGARGLKEAGKGFVSDLNAVVNTSGSALDSILKAEKTASGASKKFVQDVARGATNTLAPRQVQSTPQTNTAPQVTPSQPKLDQAEFGSFEPTQDPLPSAITGFNPQFRQVDLPATNEPESNNTAGIVANPDGTETLTLNNQNKGFLQATGQAGFRDRIRAQNPGAAGGGTFSTLNFGGALQAQADRAAARQGLGQAQFQPDLRIQDKLNQANRILRKLPFGRPGDFRKRQSLIAAAQGINDQASILQGGENVRLTGQNALNKQAAKGGQFGGPQNFDDQFKLEDLAFRKAKARANLGQKQDEAAATLAHRQAQNERNDRSFTAKQRAAITKQIDTDVDALGPDVSDEKKARIKLVAKESGLKDPKEVSVMIKGLLTLLEINPQLSNIGQFQVEPAQNFFGSPALGLRNRSTGELDTTTVEEGFFNRGVRDEFGGLQNALEAQYLFDRELQRRREAEGF